MAKTLNSITLDAPTSDPFADVSDTFAFSGTPGFGGGGGVNDYDFRWEVDDGGGYVPIASSGTGLTTSDTNPLTGLTSTSQQSITVTCSENGNYTVRIAGAPSSGGSYTVFSSTQAVTVGNVHEASFQGTGGGVITEAATTNRTIAPALTGGGVAAIDAQTDQLHLDFICGSEATTEPNAGSHWTSVTGTPVQDTSIYYTSAASWRIQVTGSPASEYLLYDFTSATEYTMVLRARVKFDTAPSAKVEVLAGRTSGAPYAGRIGYDPSSGHIVAWIGPGSDVDSGITPSAGTWYMLDMRVTSSDGSTTYMDWQIDGSAQTQVSYNDASNPHYQLGFRAGFYGSGATGDVHIDDIAASQVSADYPIGEGYASGTTEVWTRGTTETHEGDFQATGGGIITETETTDRTLSPALTGSGVFTESVTGDHTVALAATGGGVATPDAETTRTESVAATGGGVINDATATTRSESVTATGGGVMVVDYSTVEHHSGDFQATGGGVVSESITSARTLAALLSGGGVLTEYPTTDRTYSLSATGGGVIVVDYSTTAPEQHSGSFAATGGGVISASVLAARYGAALMSGGGVITVAATSEHDLATQITGGGILSVLSATGRFATVNLTGGGVALITGGKAVALTDLGAVMDAIATALTDAGTVKRAYPYPADTVSVPCVVVGYPDTIDFDLTFQRGGDRTTIPVFFVAGKVVEKAARDAISDIIAGATGVKTVLDGDLGGSCQSLRVTDMQVMNVQISGVDYLAARFDAEVIQ